MARERKTDTRYARLVTALTMVTTACVATLRCTACLASEADGFTLGSGSLQPVTADIAGKNPGVLTAKYGFSIMKDFTPYIGTGVAYVLPEEAAVTDAATKLKTGVAGQAGVNFNLSRNSALVFDYKILHLTNDPPNSDKSSTQPQSVGIGVKVKF